MNKAFVGFRVAKQTVVVTSALAGGQGKKAGRAQARRTGISATTLACGPAAALPPAHVQAQT